MRDFLDVAGMSGATYRFRRVDTDGHHPPMGGNYLIVAIEARKCVVKVVGISGDLSRALRAAGVEASAGRHLFTRLNVSSAVRTAEHEDIVRATPDARVEVDL